MTALALWEPEKIEISRSELRQQQSHVLAKASGRTVVVVKTHGRDEKYVLDKEYFEEILQKVRGLVETLEITADQKLFNQILKAANTIDEDIRLGRLHSFEEAFGED